MWVAPVPVGFEISTAAVVARGRTETVRVGTHVAELGVALGIGDRWGVCHVTRSALGTLLGRVQGRVQGAAASLPSVLSQLNRALGLSPFSLYLLSQLDRHCRRTSRY